MVEGLTAQSGMSPSGRPSLFSSGIWACVRLKMEVRPKRAVENFILSDGYEFCSCRTRQGEEMRSVSVMAMVRVVWRYFLERSTGRQRPFYT